MFGVLQQRCLAPFTSESPNVELDCAQTKIASKTRPTGTCNIKRISRTERGGSFFPAQLSEGENDSLLHIPWADESPCSSTSPSSTAVHIARHSRAILHCGQHPRATLDFKEASRTVFFSSLCVSLRMEPFNCCNVPTCSASTAIAFLLHKATGVIGSNCPE
jgi:hypothetical protein